MRLDAETLLRERMMQAMTQKEFGERVGISYVTVSRMDNGSTGPVRPPTLRKLAAALGFTPDVLITWDDDSAGKQAPQIKFAA